MELSSYSTKELSEELEKREGITKLVIEPYESYRIIGKREGVSKTGPAIIIINED